jgi:hypothetical protein
LVYSFVERPHTQIHRLTARAANLSCDRLTRVKFKSARSLAADLTHWISAVIENSDP